MLNKLHELNDQQFAYFQKVLTRQTGIILKNRRQLSLKLQSRLRKLKLNSFDEYIARLKADSREIVNAIQAITTNETFFFRDYIHLVSLEKYLDQYVEANCVFRIWSAACSTGEEAYTIAMTVHDWSKRSGTPIRNIRIMGSDIDRNVLQHAADGVYHRYQVERSPENYHSYLYRYMAAGKDDYFSVKPAIKKMVQFKHFNLIQPFPFKQRLDVIFCRNVFLYFDQNLRNQIFKKFHAALKPGGLLVMGLCEPIPVSLDLDFKCLSHSMYQKNRP